MTSAAAHGLATYAGDRILDAWFPNPVLGAAAVPVAGLGDRDPDALRGTQQRPVTDTIDLDEPPADTPDVYLRLHLLSKTRVAPHAVNLDGIFGVLPNNAWTDRGPLDPAEVETARARAGAPLRVT
ncbi:MAG: 2,3,4,5-tetrahydropyridine-2,6-dicarboxylate N-succinyltransferase [Solirubrobacteraceae bacterium]|nr:2,3,4,5-tetrahydropyridine-2,6-dicarboxylate N-succinyltransferase [Solirubrobacteraceae bacterium]